MKNLENAKKIQDYQEYSRTAAGTPIEGHPLTLELPGVSGPIVLDEGAMEVLRAYFSGGLEARKISIGTPAGSLVAEVKGASDEYPGFFISIVGEDGTEEVTTMVEYHSTVKRYQTVVYCHHSDEPVSVRDYETGKEMND